VIADRPGRLARRRTVRRLLFAALICAMPVVAARADTILDARIAAIVAAEGSRGASALRDPAWLAQVYPPSNAGPVWFTAAVPHRSVAVALHEIRAAADRGLRPDDYAVAALERLADTAARTGATTDDVARADVALTTAILRFVSDARFGRVRPQDVAPHFGAPAKDARFVAALRDTVAADGLAAAIDAAEPALPLYARLKALLTWYRTLAGQPAPALPEPAPPRRKIVDGDAWAGTAALHDRLVLVGDLAATVARPVGDRYSGELVAAVRRFQSRHGLEPDGVLGMQTIAALNVPVEARVAQVELALERLRWLPDLPPGPAIAINIPSFQLWALADASDMRGAALSMPAVVGRAVRNETPVFIGSMRAVEFSPYWNVPPAILNNELLPRLARDPGYLQREGMELVPVRGNGAAIASIDAVGLAALRDGTMRLRQRPGPRNALGGVKFVLPNTMEIYLHGTPEGQLFERTRRDFSHGCIRVREPAALAAFVLQGLPEWTPEAIDAAMTSGQNRWVRLPAPVPVIVFYTTAIVDGSGRALFMADVYGHDRKLLEALRRK
jgi:murein L,D-transpeptidase YcbB/YkuD